MEKLTNYWETLDSGQVDTPDLIHPGAPSLALFQDMTFITHIITSPDISKLSDI